MLTLINGPNSIGLTELERACSLIQVVFRSCEQTSMFSHYSRGRAASRFSLVSSVAHWVLILSETERCAVQKWIRSVLARCFRLWRWLVKYYICVLLSEECTITVVNNSTISALPRPPAYFSWSCCSLLICFLALCYRSWGNMDCYITTHYLW